MQNHLWGWSLLAIAIFASFVSFFLFVFQFNSTVCLHHCKSAFDNSFPVALGNNQGGLKFQC